MRVLFLLLISTSLFPAPMPHRDPAKLPEKERVFAEQLSLAKRRVFCGRFNHSQREKAMKYAVGRNRNHCLTPDEAVIRVMEESGMSLAVKSRRECELR